MRSGNCAQQFDGHVQFRNEPPLIIPAEEHLPAWGQNVDVAHDLIARLVEASATRTVRSLRHARRRPRRSVDRSRRRVSEGCQRSIGTGTGVGASIRRNLPDPPGAPGQAVPVTATERPSRSVTSKALAVLGTFDPQHARRTLTEISVATGLPLSTTHRLVAELVAWEGLTRGADGRYEIGRRIWMLGSLTAVSRELRATALPFMQDLSATTGENVHIAVLDDDRALYIDRISGRRAVPVVSRPGARLPLHATGVGKVLLAHGGAELQERVLLKLTRHTARTTVDARHLRRQLQQIVERGYATTHEEMTPGSSSVAVPVFDRSDRVVAALGLVTASTRREQNRMVPAVQLAGRAISRILGSTR
jgi:DNA-binding IclR family transcriptional regulator